MAIDRVRGRVGSKTRPHQERIGVTFSNPHEIRRSLPKVSKNQRFIGWGDWRLRIDAERHRGRPWPALPLLRGIGGFVPFWRPKRPSFRPFSGLSMTAEGARESAARSTVLTGVVD